MKHLDWWSRLRVLMQAELRHLTTINPSDRRWQMPLAAALAIGLLLLIGAYLDHLDYGLIGSLGGMVFLYLPATPLQHRMILLMACSFGMAACFTLGVISSFFPPVLVPVLVFVAVLVTMVCRYYGVSPPGSLFFVMATAIGAYSPVEVLQVPHRVGLIVMGSLVACLVALIYSVYILRRKAPDAVAPLPPASFDFVVFDAVVIGVFVGIALALAQALQLDRPYWVPVSCLAVIQGVSLRAVWNKQLHRILGTGVGLLVAWGLLSLPLGNWSVALIMIALAFVIETLVVRHYGLAVIFITPLTILLAEAATLGQGSAAALIEARFIDTVLGCLVGLLGGVCLHSPRFREVVGTQMRRLVPSRLVR